MRRKVEAAPDANWVDFEDASGRCVRAPHGWQCLITAGHDGPCAARPSWWNLIDRWRFRGVR